MSLSQMAILKAAAKEKPYKLSDGSGLHLLVQPTASGAVDTSYGGTSGGGLWRAYMNAQKHLMQLRLLGVAYFQTPGDERKIICHGPKSFYEVLRERMSQKWPDDFG